MCQSQKKFAGGGSCAVQPLDTESYDTLYKKRMIGDSESPFRTSIRDAKDTINNKKR